MASIKSYTDIEQSKKLAEILPLESADMCYFPVQSIENNVHYNLLAHKEKAGFPCWSLAALFGVLPERTIDICYVPYLQKENGKYSIAYGDDELLCIADNPVDACVAMVEKLNELNLL